MVFSPGVVVVGGGWWWLVVVVKGGQGWSRVVRCGGGRSARVRWAARLFSYTATLVISISGQIKSLAAPGGLVFLVGFWSLSLFRLKHAS